MASEKFRIETQRYPASVFLRAVWASVELLTGMIAPGGAGAALDRTGIEISVKYRSTGATAVSFKYPTSEIAAAQTHTVSLRRRLRDEPLEQFCQDLGIWPLPT